MKRPLEMALWRDCETDEEKAIFVKSGRAVDTGIIAPSISCDLGRTLAQSVRMKAALERCRDKFEEYSRIHTEKADKLQKGWEPMTTVEVLEKRKKAVLNAEMVKMCEEALKC